MYLPPEIHKLKDGSSFILRSGVADDAARLLEVIGGYIVQNDGILWEPGEYQKTEADIRVWIDGMLANECEMLLLAQQDGEILGNIDFHIGGRRRIRHTGEFGMAVAPAHRGRGIGGLLLGRMIQWAKSVSQIERIELRTISTNAQAIGLYRKFGFKEEGLRPRHIKYADGSYADDLLMGLDLQTVPGLG
jgi:RimJ/RimL family protein N-acetyltransferase